MGAPEAGILTNWHGPHIPVYLDGARRPGRNDSRALYPFETE
jgi:hypothetical protein